MGSLHSKYDSFADSAQLRQKLRQALGLKLLRLIRGEASDLWRAGDRIARLREYQRKGQSLRISPMVPPTKYDLFSVESVNARTVVFHKSNGQILAIPAQRIDEVLESGDGGIPLVLVKGRLQWTSLREIWQFFPDSPPPNDPPGIGYAKQHSSSDEALNQQLGQCAYETVFSNREQIANRRSDGWEVFLG
jgi:hypothetical protein